MVPASLPASKSTGRKELLFHPRALEPVNLLGTAHRPQVSPACSDAGWLSRHHCCAGASRLQRRTQPFSARRPCFWPFCMVPTSLDVPAPPPAQQLWLWDPLFLGVKLYFLLATKMSQQPRTPDFTPGSDGNGASFQVLEKVELFFSIPCQNKVRIL